MVDTTKGFIKGEIIFTIYENKDNRFSIIKIKIEETNETFNDKEIIVKGNFFNLQKGMKYLFHGELDRHPRFGMQYNAYAYQTYIPKTKEAIINYLSSDLFQGIGKKTALAIVEELGENAIDDILNDSNNLEKVPKLSKKVKKSLINQLQENQGFEKIAIELTQFGIGLKKAQEIYAKYKDEAVKIIRENPYQFVYDIEGISFVTTDRIAAHHDISTSDPKRIRASAVYTLQLSTMNGHVYLPQDDCIDGMFATLNEPTITNEMIATALEALAREQEIIKKADRLYLPSLYYAEDHFTAHLKKIMEDPVEISMTDADLLKVIGEIEEMEIISYGEEQFEAIRQALHSKVMILTGGPGTGKTTVIKGIIAAYAKLHDLPTNKHEYRKKSDFPFILTAPTGRAAKRVQESTGFQAMTIHRLLGWDGHLGFEKNEYEKLKGKMLIIDEFSMVDVWLANQLFKAIPEDMQVLIVGDEDQLPSVGPGQVLADLYQSATIPTITLNEVYRQKEGSKIIQLAHEIKHNKCDRLNLTKANDFNFISCEANQIIDVIELIVDKAVQKGVAFEDIQVLAPMYKSNVGIHQINQRLQQLLNPKNEQRRERQFNDIVFRVGDRVLQLVNQPEDGVYNGDIGKIVQIFKARETEEKQEQMVVEFDEREVIYPRNKFINLMHAYCISIHKAQGSEFPIVILPVVMNYRRMLRKNLLYTAITRSKSSLILCGDKDAFIQGIERIDTDKRHTTLKESLLAKITSTDIAVKDDESEATTPNFPEDVEEMEEEEADFSPYDFM